MIPSLQKWCARFLLVVFVMNALFPASLEAKGDSPSQNPETRNQDQQKHERKTKHDDVQLNQKYTGNKLERARKSMK